MDDGQPVKSTRLTRDSDRSNRCPRGKRCASEPPHTALVSGCSGPSCRARLSSPATRAATRGRRGRQTPRPRHTLAHIGRRNTTLQLLPHCPALPLHCLSGIRKHLDTRRTLRMPLHYTLRPTPEQPAQLKRSVQRCRARSSCALEQRTTLVGTGQGRASSGAEQQTKLPALKAWLRPARAVGRHPYSIQSLPFYDARRRFARQSLTG